ncbi:MAG: methylmalonyl-CoA epimerase [Ardenticatenaceae bacterium]|nr:methylmalonyl-CoA epimerase [Ardenticatenaceae bacterium]HBY95778.1 methylmalonyl-CoA epimerase [Chloroflexota bacterium]
MLERLDHVGIAVDDLDAALALWRDFFGLAVTHDETVPEQGTRVVFLEGGNTEVELLGALGPETPVGKFLVRRGPGIHHLCFAVDNLESAIAECQARGLEMIDTVPRIGAQGKRLAFVHPKSAHGVLIELYQAGSGE